MSDILVNAEQWNALSRDEQNQIIGALRGSGTLKLEDQIVPAESVDKELDFAQKWNPFEGLCKLACDTAAAAGAAACLNLGNPTLIAACLIVVKQAHKKCRKECED